MKNIFVLFIFLFFSSVNANDAIYNEKNMKNDTQTFYDVLKEVKEIMNYVLIDTSLSNNEKSKLWDLINKKIDLLEVLITEKGNNSHYNGPTQSVMCATCKSTGSNPNCKVCGGDGYVWTPDNAGNEKTCFACKGTGQINGKECQGCKGSGWANASPNPPKNLNELKRIYGR